MEKVDNITHEEIILQKAKRKRNKQLQTHDKEKTFDKKNKSMISRKNHLKKQNNNYKYNYNDEWLEEVEEY